ncbi:hypothetical protein ABIF76_008237, partial [Bradyrhizobium ottawaense]
MLILQARSRPGNMHEIICPHCTKAFKVDE